MEGPNQKVLQPLSPAIREAMRGIHLPIQAQAVCFTAELVWGKLPVAVHEGDSWKVEIKQPWELGGPGTQTISVVQIDEKHHTIMLKREGSSEVFYDGDAKQLNITTKDGKKVKMDLTPVASHWTGYTIFKKGIVISDELLVTRPINLKADSLSFTGKQREYILLNAMPVD
jgi:hypothetical protein